MTGNADDNNAESHILCQHTEPTSFLKFKVHFQQPTFIDEFQFVADVVE